MLILFLAIPLFFAAVDCGDPGAPDNGARALNPNSLFRSTVTYTCNTGYDLIGSASAVCQPGGVWSQPPAVCQRKDLHCYAVCPWQCVGCSPQPAVLLKWLHILTCIPDLLCVQFDMEIIPCPRVANYSVFNSW